LAKPGPTRSPKAIQNTNAKTNLNVIKNLPSPNPSSEPIIIDLLPYPSISGLNTLTTKKPLETSIATSTRSNIITTKAPVVITAKPKTTAKPRVSTTTQAPIGFGMNLWRALFGNNIFDTTTVASIKKKPTVKIASPKPSQIIQRPIEITQKPVQILKSTTHTSHIMSAISNKTPSFTTPRSVNIADIQVASTALADSIGSASVSTPSSISSTTLLNNPNPRLNDISTSTYSPEDDAKFLAVLLRAIQTGKSRFIFFIITIILFIYFIKHFDKFEFNNNYIISYYFQISLFTNNQFFY